MHQIQLRLTFLSWKLDCGSDIEGRACRSRFALHRRVRIRPSRHSSPHAHDVQCSDGSVVRTVPAVVPPAHRAHKNAIGWMLSATLMSTSARYSEASRMSAPERLRSTCNLYITTKDLASKMQQWEARENEFVELISAYTDTSMHDAATRVGIR